MIPNAIICQLGEPTRKAPGRLVELVALAEPQPPARGASKAGAVVAFCFAALQSGDWDAAVAVKLAAEQFECVPGDRRMVGEVFSDCVLIEDHREEWPGRGVRHPQPSPSVGSSSKCSANSSGVSSRSPWRESIALTLRSGRKSTRPSGLRSSTT